MRKFVVMMILMSLIVFGLKDVPRNHWAYDAVVSLMKLGIISGYPDGTFRGNETVTRYQLAVSLYRTILYLKRYVKSFTSSSYSLNKKVSEMSDMVSKAYKWSSENYASLSELKRELDDVSKKLKGINEGENIYNEIASLKSEILDKLIKLDKEYRSKIEGVVRDLDTLKASVESLKSEVQSLKNDKSKTVDIRQEALSEASRVSEKDLKNLKRYFDDKIKEMGKNLDITSSGFQKDLEKLENEVKGNLSEIESLKKDLEAFRRSLSMNLKNVKNLQDRLKNLERKHDVDFKVLDKKIDYQTSRLSEKIDSLSVTLESSVSSLKKDLESLRNRDEDMGKKILIMNSEILDLKDAFSSVKNDLEELSRRTTKSINTQSVEMKNIKEKLNELEKEYSDLYREVNGIPTKGVYYIFLVISVVSLLISVVSVLL